MDERRCELVTLAAARRLRATYCMLAHGSRLAARSFFTKILDALDFRADSAFRELNGELRETLVVGRPIAGD